MRLFKDWFLLPQRIALHEPTATAVLADVHLGYTKARQLLGDAIPSRSTSEELQPLTSAAAARPIRQLIVAGDLFERGFDRTDYEAFLDVLTHLNIHWLGLVPGNHDRGAAKALPPLPLFPEGYDLAGWRIAHGHEPGTTSRTISGHWHPAFRWRGRKYPCFLAHGSDLILPAFSRDAAGVDVRTDPRWRAWQAYLILDDDVVKKTLTDR